MRSTTLPRELEVASVSDREVRAVRATPAAPVHDSGARCTGPWRYRRRVAGGRLKWRHAVSPVAPVVAARRDHSGAAVDVERRVRPVTTSARWTG